MPVTRLRRSAAPTRATLFLPVAALLVALLAAGLAPRAAHAKPRAERADELYQQALEQLRQNSIDTRRVAIDRLEEATRLAPGDPQYELTLARTYYQAGFIRLSRERFERVKRLAPGDAEARFGLGQVWRRDWLKYLERSSLDLAVENLRAAVRIQPSYCDAWLLLVPLLVEQTNLSAAASAAWHARLADPQRPEALIAYAYTSYRLGQVERADSAFTAGVPRLRRSVRDRFEDIAPVASEQDTFALRRLEPSAQAEFVRSFWKDHDPDLATLENEAKLEYWSRVSHAYFIYYDQKRREWDMRGEVYVRYGAPMWAIYNPVTMPLYTTVGQFGVTRTFAMLPANVLQWEYPELGMRVIMQDRLLSEYYMLPVHMEQSMDPVPDPERLVALPDAMITSGGRGVFPAYPPGVEKRPVGGALARFEGPLGGRLVASLEAEGPPADSLWADYVVLDSALVEVGRQRRTLAPSACDPAEAQVADFSGDYPPGRYTVGITVRDSQGRRGIWRAPVELRAPEAALALSDVAISCGLPIETGTGDAPPGVRLEPNPNARVRGAEPLTAYFEISHLRTDRDGRARFEYVYTVSSAERDRRIWIQRLFQPRREPPPISATREEEQPGSLRRQFVRVPVQSLPVGIYRIEITVRDLIARSEATAEAQFVRLDEAPQN